MCKAGHTKSSEQGANVSIFTLFYQSLLCSSFFIIECIKLLTISLSLICWCERKTFLSQFFRRRVSEREKSGKRKMKLPKRGKFETLKKESLFDFHPLDIHNTESLANIYTSYSICIEIRVNFIGKHSLHVCERLKNDILQV